MNYAYIMSSSKYTNSKREYQLIRFVDVIQLSKSKLMIFVQNLLISILKPKNIDRKILF